MNRTAHPRAQRSLEPRSIASTSWRERCSALQWGAWLCAALLAVLQGHFFLDGYRLTGDDVLFENVVLHGKSFHYIVQTALQQGRVGAFVLVPLTLLGSHYSDYLLFRIAYVLLWYVDMLLFSIWVARVAQARLALPVFLALVAIQPMIGYHMPPVGYPLELGLPLLVMLATRLAFPAERPAIPDSRGSAAQLGIHVVYALYLLAMISSEYMIIVGTILLAAEIGAGRSGLRLRQLRMLAGRYRRDIVILALVYLAYAWFRQSQPTHYDGATLDGLGHGSDLLRTFALHVASATWLPFLDRSALVPTIWPGSLLAAVLCAVSLLSYWRFSRQTARSPTHGKWLAGGALLLGVVAITLPVVAARKQQIWCVIDHNCSYLDSRISLFFMLAAIGLALASLCRSGRTRDLLYGLALPSLALCSALGHAVNAQQTQGMKTAASAWTRARAIACISSGIIPAQASQYIDPDHYIPMHTMMNRDAFWHDYMARLAREGRCSGEPPARPPFLVSVMHPDTVYPVRLDGAGLRYLGSGWSHAETGGVWSDGTPALIVTRLAPSPVPLKLMLTLQAYAPAEGQPQEVAVEVNGSPASHWKVVADQAALYEIDIPTVPAKTGGRITIRLDIMKPVSPLQRHQSTDARRLGVLLSHLELRAH